MNELNQFGYLEEHVNLKKYNTYRINTTCRYMLHPDTTEKLQAFLKYAKTNHIPFFVLGNGSNVIFSDTEYEGVIIKLDKLQEIKYQGVEVYVTSGVMINSLAFQIIDHGLMGLEWASGIPGTVGGCIFGNAEAYKTSTFDCLKEVTFLDCDGEIKTLPKESISHGYRTSYFKENPGNIILSATFSLEYGDKKEAMMKIKSRQERRMATQPLNYPSAGSVFRNPSENVSSWQLITDAGLKGLQIGDAKVSELHANFIINVGSATGKNIRDLIEYIKEKVKEKYQVNLILEQEYKDW